VGLRPVTPLWTHLCGGEAFTVALQERLEANLDVELHLRSTEGCIDATSGLKSAGINKVPLLVARSPTRKFIFSTLISNQSLYRRVLVSFAWRWLAQGYQPPGVGLREIHPGFSR